MLVATAPITEFLQNLRANRLRCQDATDGQLLELFAQRRDESAFEALVRRHGAMVLGVCRRILRNNHDAEDAFQATFLVLACKAGMVRPRHMVAGWLYSVACNTALKLRGTLARRRVIEREAAAMPRPEPPSDAWRQLEPLLDDTLRGLPDKYRVPIVLCDLEGKSRKEAARQLGWPEGTVATRLARGRQMLARRLARHGLALSATALATVVSENLASASVPPALVKSVARIGPLIAAGEMPANALSTSVAQLTQGVLQAMLMTKLKIAVALCVALAVLAVVAAYPSSASPQNQNNGGGASPQILPPLKAEDKTDGAKKDEQAKAAAPVTLELPAVVIDEVDLKYKTISVTIAQSASTSSSGGSDTSSASGSSTSAGKPLQLVNLPLDKHAEIFVDKKMVPLGSLKPGMKLSLRLIERDGTLVAAAIGTKQLVESETAELELKLQEAKNQVDIALAGVDLAARDLEKAKVFLASAQGKAAIDKAKDDVLALEVQLQESRAIAAEAQVRAARIAAEYERVRRRDKN
jgi:RNA polymerase sigma factor (sigma-70 family)